MYPDTVRNDFLHWRNNIAEIWAKRSTKDPAPSLEEFGAEGPARSPLSLYRLNADCILSTVGVDHKGSG